MLHSSTRSMNNLLCSLALVFACGSAVLPSVAGPRPSAAGSQSSAAAPQSIGSPPVSLDVALLKAQLEDSRKFQEQLLSTVHWSLGTLATVVALLVGFGWFANFRMYERDKAALERDLRAQLLNELQKRSDEASRVVQKRFSDQDTRLESGLQDTSDRLKDDLKSQIESSEKKSAGRELVLNAALDFIKKDVANLKILIELGDREKSINDKVYRNALSKSVTALELANEIGYSYTIGEVLDLVASDIDTIFTEKVNPIDNFLVGRLVKALDSVEGIHAHAAAGLKAKAGALVNA